MANGRKYMKVGIKASNCKLTKNYMRIFYNLFFILISIISYAQSKTDIIVQESAVLINKGDYVTARNRLSEADQKTDIVSYLMTVAEYQILKQEGKSDFESVNAVRERAKNYLNKFSGKDEKHTANIKDVITGLNKINHVQTAEENARLQKQLEEQRLARLKQEKIDKLNDLLEEKNYGQIRYLLSTDSLLDSYVKSYFLAITNYRALVENEDLTLQSILSSKQELKNYLDKYQYNNLRYADNIQTALTNLTNNFPRNENELAAKKEAIKQKKIEDNAEKKLIELRSYYYERNYDYVISQGQLFPENTKSSEEVRYLVVLSRYQNFFQISSPTFEDIAAIRNFLSDYQKNNLNKNLEFKTKIEEKLSFLNSNYPKTKQEFDAKILAEKKAEENRIAQVLALNKAAERKDKIARKYREGFFALGYEGGTIAKYGLRLEFGSSKLIGFFLNARTSLVSDSQLQQDITLANKNEIAGGPNFRIAKWLFLNLGAGYGYHKRSVRNDYLQISEIETKTYIAGYGGTTFRITPTINLVAGLSFIDIDKEFYQPEYTFGLTINLK